MDRLTEKQRDMRDRYTDRQIDVYTDRQIDID